MASRGKHSAIAWIACTWLGSATSCISDGAAVDDEAEGLATSTEVRAPRLTPPREYVLASDGVTRLTLEDAGILAPGQGRYWAQVLGKALFWDQQAGSDGNACASCHYSAGADPRITNQLSPGFNDVTSGPGGDHELGSIRSDTAEVGAGQMSSGALARVNYTLTPADFPLLLLADKRDRNSLIRNHTNDVVSSQGSYEARFERVRIAGLPDRCEPNPEVFTIGQLGARQVEPRNTPTTINAAFFHANFWDGRANNTFNGVGVFGMRDIAGDPDKRLIVIEGGVPTLGHLAIKNASLASQAVGPPLSAMEMSCDQRSFADVGRKLLSTWPLLYQTIDHNDSLLGPHVSWWGTGLKPHLSYRELIKKAFPSKYWAAPDRYRIENGALVADPGGYTQMEINFSMFWGISIMLYEQTLVSDDSRFDAWFESCLPVVTNPGDPTAVPIANPVVTCLNPPAEPTEHGLTAQEVLGFGLFNNGGVGIRNPGSPACSGCHPITNVRATPLLFPTFSEAAFQEGQTFVPVERSRVDDPGFPLPFAVAGGSHDRGFFNLGLRPAGMDLGNGGSDPYGNPLSIARMFLAEQAGVPAPDPTGIANRCATPTLIEPGGTPPYPGCPSDTPPALDLALERQLVDGTFKTPTIRNVGLTPPYFHYGGYSTLRSVVEVYARGGSKRNLAPAIPDGTGDWSGTGPLGNGAVTELGHDAGTNVDFFIRDIKSTDEQIDALVAFMLTLTDPRVQCDRAPFDHPSLTIPIGHDDRDLNYDGRADDITFELPATGAAGFIGARARFCLPNAGDLFAPGMNARRTRSY